MNSTPHRIVVLDGFTLNPGDLDWAPLTSQGETTIHDRSAPSEVVSRAAGADAVLTNKSIVDRAAIEALPELKYIGVLATGYNVVDVAAATERGIIVSNVPNYSTMSVAQAVFAHLLSLTHHVEIHSHRVRQGAWVGSADFSFSDTPLIELDGLTMGLIGLGRIGTAVARIAVAFGMKVMAATRTSPPTRPPNAPEGIELTGLEQVFSRGDVLSLHCPLTPQTKELVNARTLALMKPSAFLINTGRGPLVNESDLADALNSGRLAGAALDVLSAEPPNADNPLLSAKNCQITPHHAWATQAARQRLLDMAAMNLAAFLRGQPQNVVGG